VSTGLFEWAEAYPKESLSVDQRRTQRNKWLLECGIHPLTKRDLLDPPGHTCGECSHHRQRGKYHKCDFNDTCGAATDIRISWPACELWKP
jgi:hypothetical protein